MQHNAVTKFQKEVEIDKKTVLVFVHNYLSVYFLQHVSFYTPNNSVSA